MKIFFSVGEPSGDLHGANLIGELRKRVDGVTCVGYGGPRMAAAGCQLHEDLTELAVMWVSRVLLNLHHFLRLIFRADRYFRDQRPDAVVLIDYPGLNWWIARRAKARGIPVIYYGTPQLWAWAPWRIKKMQRYVDHILCKLPFEEDWFRQRGCAAHYVGHPYFDELNTRAVDRALVAHYQHQTGPLVTILPGSRTQEVIDNLPDFLRAASSIRRELPQCRFVIACFNEAQARIARQMVLMERMDCEVRFGATPELIEAATACLACSGSVSLELLYLAKPAVISYRVSHAAYWLQSKLRNVRYITLVNLLATPDAFVGASEAYDPDEPNGVQVPFPEYLSCDDKSAQMAGQLVNYLCDNQVRSKKIEELEQLKGMYAQTGASLRAAERICDILGVAAGKISTNRVAKAA
ncbi:MAG: lipid-A-disaccharide synthase [Pirellulaceae bacterium]